MNHHFKRPLKISGIVFLVALLLTIALCTWVYFSKISDRRKEERAMKLGAGIGLAASLVVAPFWIMAADRLGKERRAKRDSKAPEE